MKTFVTRDRIAFYETDASGIIHFMFALRLFELGEREAMREAGIKIGDSRRGGHEFPRVHLSCDYHSRLFYDDLVEVQTTCLNIGNSSILWGFKIYREDELCLSGEMKVVSLNEKGHPQRVPDEWRKKLLSDNK